MRFCPFCREAFDDVSRCPVHDVELVSLRELGALAAAQGSEERDGSLWSPQRGRAQVAIGALLTLIAFFCPFGSLTGELAVTNTLFTLARGRSLRLWLVPAAALALLSVLYRRRSGVALRGARVAAVFLSLVPSAVVFYTWLGARRAAQLLAAGQVEFVLGSGAYLVWIAGALTLWGSAKLGVHEGPRLR
jgi:hypothetical protein